MFTNKLYTPLRYPGGKARFAPFLADVAKSSNLGGGLYVEPYAGGAGAALELLFHSVFSEIHINDIDPAVFWFWRVATRHTAELIDLVDRTPTTIEQWHHWRSVLRSPMGHGLVDRGFATLFMNRTNRSGILRAGAIGGKSQAGAYKLDARFNKSDIISRLLLISHHRKQIHVSRLDAYELLRNARNSFPRKTLFFLDPPYYQKGQKLYRNFYEHTEHSQIANALLHQSKHPWVVSYDDVPAIRNLYKTQRLLRYRINYSAQDQYFGRELMFFSDSIKLPSAPRRALAATMSIH